MTEQEALPTLEEVIIKDKPVVISDSDLIIKLHLHPQSREEITRQLELDELPLTYFHARINKGYMRGYVGISEEEERFIERGDLTFDDMTELIESPDRFSVYHDADKELTVENFLESDYKSGEKAMKLGLIATAVGAAAVAGTYAFIRIKRRVEDK